MNERERYDQDDRQDGGSLGSLALLALIAILIIGGIAAALFWTYQTRRNVMAERMLAERAMVQAREAEAAAQKAALAGASTEEAQRRAEDIRKKLEQLPKSEQDEVHKLAQLLSDRDPLTLSDAEVDFVHKWEQYVDVRAFDQKVDKAATALGFAEFVACVGMAKETAARRQWSFVFCHADERKRMLDVARKIKEHDVPNLSDEDKDYYKAHKAAFGRD